MSTPYNHRSIMPWTSSILRQFQLISEKNHFLTDDDHHSPYHGPYNKLLCTLFPADSDFSIFPRYELGSESEVAAVRFFLDVLYDDKLVFILEHRAWQGMIRSCDARGEADLKLRKRLEDLRRKSS
jgi:hypothetical protein